MTLDPIYQAAAFANGFAPLPDHGDCYRCPGDPAGRIDPLEPDAGLCRPCLDETSHYMEARHMEGAWHHLGDDDTDGGKWVA